MPNDDLPQSWFGLLRLFCFADRFDATMQALFFLGLFFLFLALYLCLEDDSPRKSSMLLLSGFLLTITFSFFLYALVGHCSFNYDEPSDSEILKECCKRCFSCCERSPNQEHEMNAELDSSDRSVRVKCFSYLKSNNQITSVSSPENLLQFSSHPSGERLPSDYVEMAVLNPQQQEPSQVTVDVTNSADSVQIPTEEQTQSKSDSADLGSNLAQDGDMVVLNPEQQGPSPSQEPVDDMIAAADSRLDSDDTNAATDSDDTNAAADSRQDSDVQKPTEKQKSRTNPLVERIEL